ncbi:MAG: hypothetical protein MI724_17285 [Spirochaetales bacterium]|nr:hypothetical protein [Spirochaetales bacterium]
MGALIVGIVFLLFAVYAVLPASIPFALLNWWEQVKIVLAGGIPLLALFIGFIAIMIGIADIKDKIEAKKEEEEEARAAAEAEKNENADNAKSADTEDKKD